MTKTPAQRRWSNPERSGDIYLHYGDAQHLPMQTVAFKGSVGTLYRKIKEAEREGRPVRVQQGHRTLDGKDVQYMTDLSKWFWRGSRA